jgi:UDP-N-acetylglucosamine--N-acetylmuramyl-(pentapeptide) pyrophosphoryl-undecaprenol N-acetylglucosamine transferase
MMQKTILIMAGGTGGHIIPGLAVAQELEKQGHRVAWLGGVASSMEARLVPQHKVAFHSVDFGGVRGKGVATKLLFPIRLLKAVRQARAVMSLVKPDVVLGMGGYITVPGGLAAKLAGVPIVLHEQNSIAGLSNKLLAKIAARVLSGFPNVLPNALWLGNPVKTEMTDLAKPEQRFKERAVDAPLRIAVVGGSLGAQALNTVVPQALAKLPAAQRPEVVHQAGEKMIDALNANYTQAGVSADCVPFIHDMAALYAGSDLLICRAGAMTISELAAAGVASILVPYPHAVDDHQTANTKLLTDVGAATCIAQRDLTPEWLANTLAGVTRESLLQQAQAAQTVAKPNATADVAKICLDAAK